MATKKRKQLIQFQDWIARMYPELGGDTERGIANMARSVTWQVTDACSLACSYCYQTNKGTRRMSEEVAFRLVDDVLTGQNGFREYLGDAPAIILEFIGGEPFLEIALIDKTVDYFRKRAIEMNHPWAEKFSISICSNGVAYRDPKVQAFLQKNFRNISFSVTVDGTKELHDACRRFPDGRPSYDLAHDAAQDWMARGYYMGSKITMAPENIKYFADCLKQMIYDGYEDINANEVFEDVWKPEHARVVWEQCKEFSDWIRKSEFDQEDYAISFLDNTWGMPMEETDNDNWCGGNARMLACDPDGKLFPCLRYMESSLGLDQPPIIIGDVWTGIAQKKCEQDCITCMSAITRRSQSTDECFYCPVAKGCSWCSAYNYQINGTVDKRCTFICDVQKVRSLAIVYYWNHYYKETGRTEVLDLWCPREWAVPLIGEKDYEALRELTLSMGGKVNEGEICIKSH